MISENNIVSRNKRGESCVNLNGTLRSFDSHIHITKTSTVSLNTRLLHLGDIWYLMPIKQNDERYIISSCLNGIYRGEPLGSMTTMLYVRFFCEKTYVCNISTKINNDQMSKINLVGAKANFEEMIAINSLIDSINDINDLIFKISMHKDEFISACKFILDNISKEIVESQSKRCDILGNVCYLTDSEVDYVIDWSSIILETNTFIYDIFIVCQDVIYYNELIYKLHYMSRYDLLEPYDNITYIEESSPSLVLYHYNLNRNINRNFLNKLLSKIGYDSDFNNSCEYVVNVTYHHKSINDKVWNQTRCKNSQTIKIVKSGTIKHSGPSIIDMEICYKNLINDIVLILPIITIGIIQYNEFNCSDIVTDNVTMLIDIERFDILFAYYSILHEFIALPPLLNLCKSLPCTSLNNFSKYMKSILNEKCTNLIKYRSE